MLYEHTQFGFNFGAAEVIRYFTDEKKGWVVLGVETPKECLQIYVTKTGKVRISNKNGAWIPPQRKENKCNTT